VIRFGPGPECVLVGASSRYEEEPVGSRWSPKELYVSTHVLRTGRSARINPDDLTRVGGPDADVLRLRGFLHQVGSPIVVEGNLWGAMTLNSSLPLSPDVDGRLEGFTELIATAIANTESRDAIALLAEEQDALRRVATLVARGVSPSELFSAAAEEVARVVGVDTVTIDRYDDDGCSTVLASFDDPGFPVGSRWPLDGPSLGATVLETGRSARIDDYQNLQSTSAAAMRAWSFKSAVGAPIVVDDRVWGVICAGSTAPQPMAETTEARLVGFTELLATAIARAEASAALIQLADEQAALRRVATLVAEGAEPTVLFSAVAAEVANVLDVALSAVVRYEPGDIATQVGAWGEENPFPVGTSWKLDESSVSGLVAKTGLPARVPDYGHVPGDISTTLVREAGIQSAVGAPILVDGDLWGLMMALSTEDKPLPADTETRLANFTELIATAISNATARTELVESRARIVTATDEARRRIERDLHDGTQQRLVSLALAARAAAGDLPDESNGVRQRLTTIATSLGQAVEELQELSRGIHPAILSDAGLAPALEALALRSPIPVELRAATKERFPEPVEVAAYFVASETLANAAKHSRATRIDVEVTLEAQTLLLSIHDNGIGGADPDRGSGLTGLRDRVEALGGSLEVTSKPGGGTRLDATLPLRN
jgi:signal transduction histidine kinase